jgi:hypothetical protein
MVVLRNRRPPRMHPRCADPLLNTFFKRHFAPYFKRLIKNDVLHLQNIKRDRALDNLDVLELYYRYLYIQLISMLISVDANSYSRS